MAKVYREAGAVLQEEKFTVVKKEGKAGESIPKHNHPEANVTFTVVKGKVQVLLNEGEEFILQPGEILHFDGNNYIQARMLEDSEAFVHLVLK